ncbi:ExeM/NucH family extracellular endonuclease [Blastococcus sp. SYSU D00922]
MAVVGLPALAQAAPPTTPYISEFHYDDDGADAGEFVEVTLPAGTTSQGLSVVLYNGNGGASYTPLVTFPSVTAPADAPIAISGNAVGAQNGAPDGLALVQDGKVLEFLSYEGTFTASNGPAAGRTSVDVGVAEAGTEPDGLSLSLRFDAAGAGAWYPPAPNTRNQVNPTFEAPDSCDVDPTHEIGQVQGSGASTPLPGQQVTVRGVVVGDTPGLSGFYLQSPDGDGDAATSDGIFIESGIAVDLGDTVAVTGGVRENFGQTQITSREDVAVCEDGDAADLPKPVLLDLPATAAEREPFEGMRVTPDSSLVVSEVFTLARYGELMLAADRVLVQPTELARPGTAAAAAVAEDNALRQIVLDDASNATLSVTNRPYLSPATPVRVGDTVTFTEPTVLGFGFGDWRLQPADGTADGTFAPQNTRSDVSEPDEVGGDVQIAAFNVLNYFISFGPESRGAPNQAELEEQAAKIVPAIQALDADVVTLMEIEDTDSTGHSRGNADGALADLVTRLNTAEGSQVWSYVPLPDELYEVDRDVIRSAIIYRHDVVQPVGDPVGLADEDVWFNAREPQAQTFVKDGDAFTVVANHFKSKGSPPEDENGDPIEGDPNNDYGQGNWNVARVAQAESLAAFADVLQESTGDHDVVLMGDFNAYTQEDPIVELAEAGYGDLGEEFDPGRYSYVFDALSGSLDHALATAELRHKVTGLAHWNINAVESSAYQYDGDAALYAPDPYRSSDHDPLVLGIDLEERCQGLLPTITGTNRADVLKGTNGRDVIMGLGGDDVITGGNGDDVICGGSGKDRLSGDNGDDVLSGGFEDDLLDGANGEDRLIGGPGADVLNQGRGKGSQEQEGVES